MKAKHLILLLSLLLLGAGPSTIETQYRQDKQLLENPGFENGITKWTKSGSSTLTKETTEKAFGAAAAAWDATANTETLTSNPVTIPKGLQQSQMCNAHVWYKGGDANLKLQVVDGSVTVLDEFTLVTSSGFTKTPDLFFPCPSSGTMALRLIASANAAVIYVDGAFLGQESATSPNVVISEWQDYTLTIDATTSAPTLGTVAYNKASWRRVGSNMEILYVLEHSSGGSTGTGDYLFPIPSGYTISSSVAKASADPNLATNLGSSNCNRAGGPTGADGLVAAYNATKLVLAVGDAGTNTTILSSTFCQINAALQIRFRASIPIAEWAGSGTFAGNNRIEYAWNSSTNDADDTSSFGYGPSGVQFINFSAARNKRVRFLTQIQPTDKIILEFTNDSGITWVDAATGNNNVYPWNFENGTISGFKWTPQSSTDVTIEFGPYRANTGATFGAAGTNWSAIAGSNTYKWRVVKHSAGIPVGFGIVSNDTAGLFPAKNSIPAFRASWNTQSYTSAGAYQDIQFSDDFDQGGNMGLTTFTVPNDGAGIYIFGVTCGLDAVPTTYKLTVALRNSSNAIYARADSATQFNAANSITKTITYIANASPGDTFKVSIVMGSAGTFAVTSCWFQGAKLF